MSRRSCAAFAATAAPGAGRGRPGRPPQFRDPDDYAPDEERTLKPRSPRTASGTYQQGQPNRANGSAPRRDSSADDYSRGPRSFNSPHGSSRRSEQERDARRAARLTDKAAAVSRSSQASALAGGETGTRDAVTRGDGAFNEVPKSGGRKLLGWKHRGQTGKAAGIAPRSRRRGRSDGKRHCIGH